MAKNGRKMTILIIFFILYQYLGVLKKFKDVGNFSIVLNILLILTKLYKLQNNFLLTLCITEILEGEKHLGCQ